MEAYSGFVLGTFSPTCTGMVRSWQGMKCQPSSTVQSVIDLLNFPGYFKKKTFSTMDANCDDKLHHCRHLVTAIDNSLIPAFGNYNLEWPLLIP